MIESVKINKINKIDKSEDFITAENTISVFQANIEKAFENKEIAKKMFEEIKKEINKAGISIDKEETPEL